MPDTSGETVFNDLPESIITQEILPRLPSRDVLRCGAVSKWWRRATSTKEFLLDHHQRQPLLPLVIFGHEDAVDALDIRRFPAERRPVLGYKIRDSRYRSNLGILASCDGLLLLSLLDGRINIVNPATRQWLAIPRLTGAREKIAGLYPHPHHSDEYRILFQRGRRVDRNAGYYVLTVGCSHNQKPKRIRPLLATGIYMRKPPVLLNGCLHWVTTNYVKDCEILIFDTIEETFRSMSLPSTAKGIQTLLDMEGTLGMRCLDDTGKIMEIWVLQDYAKETWSKFPIELPMVTYWSDVLLSHKRDMLIYTVKSCLYQQHYDDSGKVFEEYKWETGPSITEHWFKESLIKHTFFPRRCIDHVKQPRFFRRL
jgi:F-box interacting protein